MKWVWRVWCLLYFIILFYVVFFAGRRPNPTFESTDSRPLLLIPFKMKWYLYKHAIDVNSVYLDILGNIVMFVPLPLFLYIVWKVKRPHTMFWIGFIASFIVEFTQYITGVGLADIDDLVFNSLGVLCGVTIIDGIKRTAFETERSNN
ncbi:MULTISPECIES: VanZ family protein [Olivibacter]|uniref:VanZ family protein n=1 Tax=Olivibacter oleidegradans TaxID=760123 RepID=A0ABV6HGT8_9SPHI|nr:MULTISPECIES: VanZ family protein [Olivibacter]MDM8176732.1 VanZ family protein [Olivibacter sp. 47]